MCVCVSLRWVRCRPLEDWDEEEEVGERRKIKAELVWLLGIAAEVLLALNSSSRTAELDRNCAVSVSAALFCCCWLNSCRVFLSGRSPMERCKDLLYFLLFFLVSLAYQPLRSARERASASALLFQPECFSLNQSESSFVFLPLFFCLYSVIACISSLGVGEGECALHCTSLFPSLAIHGEHWQNQQN